ncbi:MAG: DUF4956 domain-containing protein [Candidatus Symbiothrix sp.]|jgi:hypothetical protein|nr:DUF4956 domain-containing protein [Candidatus Symbiothrix sp.]
MIQSDFDPQIAAEHAAELTQKAWYSLSIEDLNGIFNIPHIWTLLLSFAINVLVCWFITQFFYYKKSHRKDYYFTFILFSVTIFLLLFMLQSISMNIGFALGLFAIFGMIRYRTETLQIRDMTYLFMIIGISAVNGLSTNVPFVSVIAANLLFIVFVLVLESSVFLQQSATKIVLYEKIALITPDRYDEMLADLQTRTGLTITKVEVGHIDFLRDVAFLKVYYQAASDEINTIDNITKFS